MAVILPDGPNTFCHTRNGMAIDWNNIPHIPIGEWRRAILGAIGNGLNEKRLVALTAIPGAKPGDPLSLVAVIGDDDKATLAITATCLTDHKYAALTPNCPQAHWFERELWETWGITPVGHPMLKPIRFAPPRRIVQGVNDERLRVGDTWYCRVDGSQIHEVGVGPVHAGVIEPGHFRFQCEGETVHTLDIEFGYQHRGIEKALVGGPHRASLQQIEALSGDSTVAHTQAYCMALEALAGITITPIGEMIRGIATELERIANHIGDLGALAGDMGFLPTQSFCGRLRGDALNCTALLCGNRFSRSLLVPGGVRYNWTDSIEQELLRRLEILEREVSEATELMFEQPTVLARLERIGFLSGTEATLIGLVGPAARACGLPRDVRADYPYGIYRFSQLPVCTFGTGDCFSRAFLRVLELTQSFRFIREQMAEQQLGQVYVPMKPLRPNMFVITMTEGWRGEVCHIALTNNDANFQHYKVIDPSFHNWYGLACALRGQQISDFPLCNKSFNLSYCGHDL